MFLFAAMQQSGTDPEHRHYLEFADSYPDDPAIDPATVVVLHRSRANAAAAAERIARDLGMPDDSYPELWGNISARPVHRLPLYHVVRA